MIPSGEKWFDSPYYTLLYGHRCENDAAGTIDVLLDYLKIPKGNSVLDMACGRGRHVFCLAEKGFHVTGYDLGVQNIAHAKQEAKRRNLTENTRFAVHDMSFPFPTKDHAVVFNFFTSFGYGDSDNDHAQIIQYACDACQPGGMVVFDFLNAQRIQQELIPFEVKKIGSVLFTLRRWIENGFVFKEIQLVDGEKQETFLERVRLLTPDDFFRFFSSSGLHGIVFWGNFDAQPFTADSPRLIAMAQKQTT